jgi:predicted O-methyltransferase YrrM
MLNKNGLKRAALGIHKLGVRLGVQILPSHYYSPVPNILDLQETVDVWAKASQLPGVRIDLDQQANNLRRICTPYAEEYAGNKVYREAVANKSGPGYGYIEAQCLHGVVRHFKPSNVIEIGSGVSTHCMLAALDRNWKETGVPYDLVAIEPDPSERLKALPQIHLIRQQVQTVPFELFDKLGKGDLLFIDSSHTVKPGGDVNFLILEVLPRLRSGTVVHFHDIYLPYDYPRDTLQTFLHGMETSLLHAFLIFNQRASIIFCLSQLHYECSEVLREVFPEYVRQEDDHGLQLNDNKPFAAIEEHFPSSIYIEIQRADSDKRGAIDA